MNNRQLKRMLKEEKKLIEQEIKQHHKTNKSRRLVLMVAVLVIALTGIVYASAYSDGLEWLINQGNGYLDILEAYPDNKTDITLEDENVTIKVFGFITDEENNYLYVDHQRNDLSISKYDIINKRELYKVDNDTLNDDFFLMHGSTSIINEITSDNFASKKFYSFRVFDVDEGTAKFHITELKDMDGNIIEVDFRFDLPFKKAKAKTFKLDAAKTYTLPESDEEITIRIKEVKFLPTATYIVTDNIVPDNIFLSLRDITINNHKLQPFLLGSFGGDYKFRPMDYEDIWRINWSLETYTFEEEINEFYEIDEYPKLIDFKGHNLLIDYQIKDNNYDVQLEDLGYMYRDFNYMATSLSGEEHHYFNSSLGDTMEIRPDGTEKQVIDILTYLEADIEKIRTKMYLYTYYNIGKHPDRKPFDIEEDTLTLHIESVTKGYNVDDTIRLYWKPLTMLKNLFK